MDDDQPDVTELVTAAAAGDEAAWQELVDRYTPLLLRVVLGFRLSQAEIEDVTQTVWLRLVEQLGELREPRALPGWMVTTARREALRSARRMARVRPQDPMDDAWSSRLVSEDEPDAEMERTARHLALLEGFATLSAHQRELLLLLIQDPPLPYSEISRLTGTPVGAIGPTRARALDRLRRSPGVQALLGTSETGSSGTGSSGTGSSGTGSSGTGSSGTGSSGTGSIETGSIETGSIGNGTRGGRRS